jgi:radical SAM superfamily enzyme YgiQ (UPF0313 family)
MTGKHGKTRILCVNPWIHDFAAYDVWASPMGILILAALLRDKGFQVSYIDCLDRFHPRSLKKAPLSKHGRGPYLKSRLPLPKGLEVTYRRFSRYGIPPEWFRDDLRSMERPDLVLVTSMMTYWAGGVREAITLIKETWPDVPVVLGGIYATLCTDHAHVHSGADRVITGTAEHLLFDLVEEFTGVRTEESRDLTVLDNLPYPACDLQHGMAHIPIRASRGCPNRCAYCASGYLAPGFSRRSAENVVDEIQFWHKRYAVTDFAFYDDALLTDPENHARKIFQGIIDRKLNLRFHTPNALHVREIDDSLAQLMRKAGFHTLRLGVETTDFSQRKNLDKKISETDFRRAVNALRKAGFRKEQIGAYLLVGLPGQTLAEAEHSIREVLSAGITPVLTFYTPIPHTSLWDEAVKHSSYPLELDPVFTNNSIWPCREHGFSWNEMTYLKDLILS